MNRLFFPLTFPKRSHLLWLAWLRALLPLRPACSRTTTFLWLVLVLAALCLRPDLAGVTSLVRSLGLSDASRLRAAHPVGPYRSGIAPISGSEFPPRDLVQFPLLHPHRVPAKTAFGLGR